MQENLRGNTRKRESADIRTLSRHLELMIEELTADPSSFSRQDSADGVVLRSKAGTLVGRLKDRALVDLLVAAPGAMRRLIDYVRQLEREAYDSRDERRRSRAVLDLLYNARSEGFATPRGQALLTQALNAAEGNRDDWR